MQLNCPYKLIIFDFDNTLCNLNLFFNGIKTWHIIESKKMIVLNNKQVKIESIFNDYQKLFLLFSFLKKQNVIFCIASFGEFDTIRKIVNIAFPNIFNFILTPDNIDYILQKRIPKFMRHIIDINCPNLYSKNIMLQYLMKRFAIIPEKTIFFDDDINNIKCAQKLNIKLVNNQNTGINFTLLKKTLFTRNFIHFK